MTTHQRFASLLLGAILATAAASAHAANSFSNSLTGFTGDTTQVATQTALNLAGLNIFSTASAASATFDASGAHFGIGSVGDSGRNYLRTNISDFVAQDFVAEITFITTIDDQAIFIGVGSGDTALFGTPDWSTQLSSASFWPETANDKFTRFRTTNDINNFGDSGVVGGLDPGTHRFRMTFSAAGNTLQGDIDVNYAGGPFVADATTTNLPIDVSTLFSANGWPSEPSRIFFGGDDGTTFRDLAVTVIPEPAAAFLASLSALALLAARRKF